MDQAIPTCVGKKRRHTLIVGAWLYPAVEERCGLGWMDLLDQAAHLKPQIRKDITITKYKMVKQEQGSLVFNL